MGKKHEKINILKNAKSKKYCKRRKKEGKNEKKCKKMQRENRSQKINRQGGRNKETERKYIEYKKRRKQKSRTKKE